MTAHARYPLLEEQDDGGLSSGVPPYLDSGFITDSTLNKR